MPQLDPGYSAQLPSRTRRVHLPPSTFFFSPPYLLLIFDTSDLPSPPHPPTPCSDESEDWDDEEEDTSGEYTDATDSEEGDSEEWASETDESEYETETDDDEDNEGGGYGRESTDATMRAESVHGGGGGNRKRRMVGGRRPYASPNRRGVVSHEKIRTIYIYKNGDANFPAHKVVFGQKIRTFIYLLETITEAIQPEFGAVRKLFDVATGKVIKTLEGIETEGHYVASPGHKKYAKLKYYDIVNYSQKQRSYVMPNLTNMKYKCKPVKAKMTTEPPMKIYVLANRDKDGVPTKVILMRRDRISFQHVLDMITTRLGYEKMPANAKKLINLQTNKSVTKLSQLEDGAFYCAIDRLEAIRLPPYKVTPGGDLVKRTDLPRMIIKNKPVMFDRRITGRIYCGERRLDKLYQKGFTSDVGKVQLVSRAAPKHIPGKGLHDGMKKREMTMISMGGTRKKKKKKKLDGAYAPLPPKNLQAIVGMNAVVPSSGGNTHSPGKAMSGGDQAIWDLIHYDLIDALIIPLVEDALKEHQEKTYKLLNDYVVSRATTISKTMGNMDSPRMGREMTVFAKDLPPIPMIIPGMEYNTPPVSGGNAATIRKPDEQLPGSLDRGTTFLTDTGAGTPEVPSQTGETRSMHGVRQGRAVAAYAAAKLELEPELAPKEVKFAPVDTPESASDLPQIIVDYMQHQSADVFAENATNEEQRLAERFKGVLQMAVDGKLAAWEDDAMSLVALVIALDQFPRTIYRAKRRMYVGEEQLKIVLRRAVEETSVIQDVAPMHMLFCCLALSHQEDIYSQKLGVKLWKSVKPTFSTTDEIHKYERVFENNLAIIEELGRFPQRNKLLGRASTEAEEAWQQKKRSENQMRLQRAALAAKAESPLAAATKKGGRFRLFQSMGKKAKQNAVKA